MLFQSVSVCEGVEGVIENDKGAGGYYNWGLEQKKQQNPPQTALCCPNTHTWTRNAQITQAVSRRPGTMSKITVAFSVQGCGGVAAYLLLTGTCRDRREAIISPSGQEASSRIIVPN